MKLLSTTVCLSTLIHFTPAWAKTYYVTAGQSIQAAIDGAAAGDRIQVAAGTYAENLLITKNAIDLRGSGANLVPQASPKPNACGDQSDPTYYNGICITPGSGESISDVSVTGFTFTGWGDAIAIYYGQNTKITQNKIYSSKNTGITAFFSVDTKIQANEISGRDIQTTECIVTVFGHGTKIAQNTISKCLSGIDSETPNADIENNDISYTCLGIQVFYSDVQVSHNHIGPSVTECTRTNGAKGIIVFDESLRIAIDHNTITNQKTTAGTGLGIDIQSIVQGTVNNNVLINNDGNIRRNEQSAGTVSVTKNQCTSPSTGCNY